MIKQSRNILTHHGILGMKWGKKNGPPYPIDTNDHSSSEKKAGWQKSLSSSVKQIGTKIKKTIQNRNQSEKAYREKLTNIASNKNVNIANERWSNYRKKSLAMRIGKIFVPTHKNVNISDVRLANYRNKSLTARIGKGLVSAVTQTLIGDIMSGNMVRYSTMSKQQLRKELTKKAIALTAKSAINTAVNDALAKSMSTRYTENGKRKKGYKNTLITKEKAIRSGVNAIAIALPGINALMQTKLTKIMMNKAKREQNENAFERWGSNILADRVDNVIWNSDDFKYSIIDNRKQ